MLLLTTFTSIRFVGLCILAGLCVFVYQITLRKRRNPAGLPYPPGPKGLPILGNIFDIPSSGYVYKAFKRFGRELGAFELLTLEYTDFSRLFMDRFQHYSLKFVGDAPHRVEHQGGHGRPSRQEIRHLLR